MNKRVVKAGSIYHLAHGSLKDFFIPHSGNGYKPKSLHPKRVIFHISVAMALKALVLLFISYYPVSAWMTPDIIAGEARKIISLTNNLRAELSLPAVKENSKLNQAAYKKVQDMFINQYFAHRSPTGVDLEDWLRAAGYTNYATVGENLAMGYSNASEVMAAWRKSPTHYNNLVDPNFNEIGVSMASDIYLDKDTVFIAQYFGLPNSVETVTVTKTPIKSIEKVVTSPSKTVLSEKKNIAVPPKQTTVTVSKTAAKAPEKIVKVETVLPPETKSASATILNQEIALSPEANNMWQGQEVVSGNVEINSVVPPSLSVTDSGGTTLRSDIAKADIVPEQQSIFDQYWLYRSHPNEWMSRIFDFSSIYYKVILVLAILALGLTIFIERKKQHPHLIVSGLGLIFCLIFFIVF